MGDFTAEQMTHLLNQWAAFLDQTGGPPSLVASMDSLCQKIEDGHVGPDEANAMFLALADRVGGVSGNDLSSDVHSGSRDALRVGE